ncbi:oxaloacetate-decarboxylating malate dehydrogenase [Candidatus Eisenbacteria bacterium]|uniref:Oxaloacetate-decarboxylating malate dehydrogenase n=1 Tax=Eiseniibacteriota bacterium TaxID=2212470 RepID=A0ABV6YPF9_UNCEI
MATQKRRAAKKVSASRKEKVTRKSASSKKVQKVKVKVAKRGRELLNDPYLNKGGAFTEREKQGLGLEGLLPPGVRTIEQQAEIAYKNIKRTGASNPDLVYSALRHLKNRNETLFFRTASDHLKEFLPIIYTPEVGVACQTWSHRMARPTGVFITTENIDRVDDTLERLASREIQIAVATDNEGILGIGDQGIGGSQICVGKLALYTLAAGFAPATCLPVCLDVGTNSADLLKDPEYLGVRHLRLQKGIYFSFMDKFVESFKRVMPNAVLQFEDFSGTKAFEVLKRYRGNTRCLNDDIQGTGAVVYAAVLGALDCSKKKLKDSVIVIHGAGAGGIGVARQLLSGLRTRGLSKEDALARIYVTDSKGLIYEGRDDDLPDHKADFAMTGNFSGTVSLLDLIKKVKPNILIGTSGKTGEFTKAVVKAMCVHKKPIIMPLSNPTRNSEATPAQIFEWTKGAALVATGSPFDPVKYGRLHSIAQANNFLTFPGLGRGVLESGAKIVTDAMVTASGQALYDYTKKFEQELLSQGHVLPGIRDDAKRNISAADKVRDIAAYIAAEVVKAAAKDPKAKSKVKKPVPATEIRDHMWKPEYAEYMKG